MSSDSAPLAPGPLFDGVTYDVADLLRRMMAAGAVSWQQALALEAEIDVLRPSPHSRRQAHAFRDEIIKLNGPARSLLDQSALAFAFAALMEQPEADGRKETGEDIRWQQLADYWMLLNEQATVNGTVDALKLEAVTRREVAAGRLAPHDALRRVALACCRSWDADTSLPWWRRLLAAS